MTDQQKIEQWTKTLDDLGKPYGLDYTVLDRVSGELDAWLRDAQNDCLRARGDRRWQCVNSLQNACQILAEPF